MGAGRSRACGAPPRRAAWTWRTGALMEGISRVADAHVSRGPLTPSSLFHCETIQFRSERLRIGHLCEIRVMRLA